MSVRLSTGFCHGMTLEEPSQATRPTASRVRSAVWNSLQEELPGARILDIFAGSGAIGIEALSRGAKAACFVEKDRVALQALQRNLGEVKRRAQAQGLVIETQCVSISADKALVRLEQASFDIIWMDPPFAEITTLLPALRKELARVGRPGSWLLVESDQKDLPFVASVFAQEEYPWFLVKQKAYGKIGLSFFRQQHPSDEAPQ